jgi:deoxyguanosine kinase
MNKPVGDLSLHHIAVDGPIGVGKTSLVGLLAKRFEGVKILEDIDNPFLPDFYKNKKGAAFQTQLFFLLSRYQQQREIAQIDLFSGLVVADYTFPKDKIFACLNLDDSSMACFPRVCPSPIW